MPTYMYWVEAGVLLPACAVWLLIYRRYRRDFFLAFALLCGSFGLLGLWIAIKQTAQAAAQ